jgi:hypothetical protein
MTRIGSSLFLSIVIVCAVLAPSVAFSQTDLFQSDPGPASPAAVEAPRAKPVSRPVPRVAPKREEPPAAAPVVAPQPSSPAAKPVRASSERPADGRKFLIARGFAALGSARLRFLPCFPLKNRGETGATAPLFAASAVSSAARRRGGSPVRRTRVRR